MQAATAGTPPADPSSDPDSEWTINTVLCTLLENFLATLGYAHHRNRLKVGVQEHIIVKRKRLS